MKNFLIKHLKTLLKKLLLKLEDKELEKPIEKMNTDLILKCSKLILKIDGIPPLTEEEIRERVDKMFSINK